MARRNRLTEFFICLGLLICLPQRAQIFSGPIMRTISGGGGAPTYLFQESFEGTGYENGGWTEDAGTPNEDATNVAAYGSQSLRINTSGQRTHIASAWTAASTSYVFFAIYFTSTTVGDLVIRGENGTTDVWDLERRTDTTLRFHHGTASATTGTFANSQWLYIWVHYTAGSGANGTLDAYVSTTTTKPGSPTVSITTGTSTLGHNGWLVRLDETLDYNIDRILVDDVAIGSAP